VRFEILLWLYRPEKFSGLLRNGPLDPKCGPYWEIQCWARLNTEATIFPNVHLQASKYHNYYISMITCRPPPAITWKKNGQTIPTGDDFEIAGTFLGRRLDLINVKKDLHEDTYTCEAENSQNSGNPLVFTTDVTVEGM